MWITFSKIWNIDKKQLFYVDKWITLWITKRADVRKKAILPMCVKVFNVFESCQSCQSFQVYGYVSKFSGF